MIVPSNISDPRDLEIARLRAEVEAERFKRAGAESAYELLSIQSASVVRELERTESALSDARAALDAYQSPEAAHALALRVIEQSQRAFRAEAALDGERAKCDEAKWFIEYLSATNDGQRADAEAWLFGYRARRAAEAQPTPVRCPECDGTGRRVKYHGGSINDPNMIGLAMESLPCRCQAEARP